MTKKKPVQLKQRPVHVSQLKLVCEIGCYLDKEYGPLPLDPRTTNACIEAANIIVAAFAEPWRPVTDGMGLFAWRASDETGQSSLFMFEKLCFARQAEYAYPHDADDFGRCLGLLRAEPKLRAELPKMADTGKEWAALVANWDELESLHKAGEYQRFHDRLREIYA